MGKADKGEPKEGKDGEKGRSKDKPDAKERGGGNKGGSKAAAAAKQGGQTPAGQASTGRAPVGVDGLHPLPSTVLAEVLVTSKKERKAKEEEAKRKKKKVAAPPKKVTYQLRGFENSARGDGLALTHWVKCYKDHQGRVKVANPGDYPFARYNKKVTLYRYNDEEYETVIAPEDDAGWSREETDYLLSLAELYDGNFTIVADRYEWAGIPAAEGRPAVEATERCMEALQARYCSVAKRLLIAREGCAEVAANSPLLRHPYDAVHETARKTALSRLLARTAAQEAEEAAILAEARTIEAARRMEAASSRMGARPGLLHPADFDNDPGGPPLYDASLTAVRPAPGVHLRGAHLRKESKSREAALPGGSRALRTLEALLEQVGYNREPNMLTRRTSALYLALRSEAIAHIELKKKIAHGSITTPAAAGEGFSKRAEKRKVASTTPLPESLTPRNEKRQRVQKKYE